MITERHREFLLKLLRLRAYTVSEEIFLSDMETVTKELTDIRHAHDALNATDLSFKQCHCGSFLVPAGTYSLTDSNYDTHFLDAPCIKMAVPTPLPVTPPTLPEGSTVDLGTGSKPDGIDDDIPF